MNDTHKRIRIYALTLNDFSRYPLISQTTPQALGCLSDSKVKSMKEIIVVIGSGSIAQAIARRVSVGKTILLADINPENAKEAEQTLSRAGFEVRTTGVDVCSRESIQALVKTACELGEIKGVIHTAGLSPSRPKRRISSALISMVRRSCLRRLVGSLRLAAQPLLSVLSPAIVFMLMPFLSTRQICSRRCHRKIYCLALDFGSRRQPLCIPNF
jgi:ribosomal protein S9